MQSLCAANYRLRIKGEVLLFQLLNALQLFGANLDDYLHLLLPPVVKLFDSTEVPIPVRRWVFIEDLT